MFLRPMPWTVTTVCQLSKTLDPYGQFSKKKVYYDSSRWFAVLIHAHCLCSVFFGVSLQGIPDIVERIYGWLGLHHCNLLEIMHHCGIKQMLLSRRDFKITCYRCAYSPGMVFHKGNSLLKTNISMVKEQFLFFQKILHLKTPNHS